MYLVKTKGGIRALETKPAPFDDLTEQAKQRYADAGFFISDQLHAYTLVSNCKPYEWKQNTEYRIKLENCFGKQLCTLEKIKFDFSVKRPIGVWTAEAPFKFVPLPTEDHLFDALRYGTAMHKVVFGYDSLLAQKRKARRQAKYEKYLAFLNFWQSSNKAKGTEEIYKEWRKSLSKK